MTFYLVIPDHEKVPAIVIGLMTNEPDSELDKFYGIHDWRYGMKIGVLNSGLANINGGGYPIESWGTIPNKRQC